jgi:hypothetical protein
VAVGTIIVQQAIDQIGYGRFQRRILVVCGVTWAADAAEVLLIGFALPAIRAEFGLDPVTGGLLATVTFVGMLLEAWLWDPVADRVGRRLGFMTTVAIFAVFGLLSAFAPNVAWLLVRRLLTGFGLGGALPLDFALYAEYLPSRNRGRNLVLLESFWAGGTIIAAGLAWLLVPTPQADAAETVHTRDIDTIRLRSKQNPHHVDLAEPPRVTRPSGCSNTPGKLTCSCSVTAAAARWPPPWSARWRCVARTTPAARSSSCPNRTSPDRDDAARTQLDLSRVRCRRAVMVRSRLSVFPTS